MKSVGLELKKKLSLREVKADLASLLTTLNQSGGGVIVTQAGKPKAVLMDLDSYEEIIETLHDLSQPGFLDSLLKAQKEIRDGKGIPAEQVYKELGLE